MEPRVPRVTLTLPAHQRRARGRLPGRRRGQGARRCGARSATRPTCRRPAAHVRPGAGDAHRRARPARGRGARAVSERRFIGIDVGGTKIAVAALQDGELERSRRPCRRASAASDALLDQLVAQIETARTARPMAVGIGLPVDRRVRHRPHPLTASTSRSSDVPLRELLTERAGLPVYVENDASCAALAEASDGGRIVVENLVMFTIGTGVGGGLVLGGRLYRGATGAGRARPHAHRARPRPTARPPSRGAFPQPGSLETLAAGRALDRLAIESAREHPKSFLGRAARRGRRDHRPRRGRGRRRRATCTAGTCSASSASGSGSGSPTRSTCSTRARS